MRPYTPSNKTFTESKVEKVVSIGNGTKEVDWNDLCGGMIRGLSPSVDVSGKQPSLLQYDALAELFLKPDFRTRGPIEADDREQAAARSIKTRNFPWSSTGSLKPDTQSNESTEETGRKREVSGNAESSPRKRQGRVFSRPMGGYLSRQQQAACGVSLKGDESGKLDEIQEEADFNPNFVGDAYYYKLPDPANRKHIEGIYTIVYTRPVGEKFDPINNTRCVLFQPSIERTIRINTSVPSHAPQRAQENIRELLTSDSTFAACCVSLENTPIDLAFCIDAADKRRGPESDLLEIGRPLVDIQGKSEVMRWVENMVFKTTFRFIPRHDVRRDNEYDGRGHSTYAKYPELMKIFSKKLPDSGHTISFGIKGFGDKNDGFEGFHFVEIELACEDPVNRTGARQLIVAVRIPEQRDLPKQILRQKLTKAYDLEILTGDPNERTGYFNYGETDDMYRPIGRGTPYWTLDSETDVGLIHDPSEFDPGFLERRLIHHRYPIDELARIYDWIQRTIQEALEATGFVDVRLLDANLYAGPRLDMMKAEHMLRVKFSGSNGSSPTGVLQDVIIGLGEIDDG